MNTSEVSEENQISKTGGYGGENRWLWGGATSGEYWYRLFARHKFFLLFFIEFYRIL